MQRTACEEAACPAVGRAGCRQADGGPPTEYDAAGTWRTKWAQFVTHSAFQHGSVPVWWDNGYTSNHTMGLFDRNTGAQAFPGLITTITDASK